MTLMLALLWGCSGPPAERVFERDVVPALQRSCLSAGCHGVAPGAEVGGDVIDWERLFIQVDDDGRVLDVEQARQAALRSVDTTGAPDSSSLLRKPLSTTLGGAPHFGGAAWTRTEDPDYIAIWSWIALEEAGGEDPAPFNDLEQQFSQTVQPALLSMGCATGGCHGTRGAVPFRLDPGLLGEVGIAATRHNYESARVMLDLGPEPTGSRLLRKALPIDAGGIVHRGGNRAFLRDLDDTRAQAIIAWACAERAEIGWACGEQPTGLIFVVGTSAVEDPFDAVGTTLDTDLVLAHLDSDGQVTGEDNLTASLHSGPTSVLSPAVSPDGTEVVFTMHGPDGHRVWAMDPQTRVAEPLTHGPGDDREPTYGPDNTVWFVSTRDGSASDTGMLDAELYVVDRNTGIQTRRTWTPHIERRPVWLHTGEEAGGEIAFTALRSVFADQVRAHPFRMPPGLDTEYHQHFGITPPETLFDDLAELPDGRYALVVGEREGSLGAGQLGIVDRNMGPELPNGESAGIPGYIRPLVRLDPSSGSSGRVERAYDHPTALPDGRLLVSVASDVDLDGSSAPEWHLEILSLAETVDGPVIASRQVISDMPGRSEWDPAVVVRSRIPEVLASMQWDASQQTGLLVHQGMGFVDNLLGHLPPSGARDAREDIAWVRLVEPMPLEPGRSGAGSLNGVAPARVLAELPLADDGSFQVRIPSGTSFRLQALDADGLAVGHPHNRWLDMSPGQVMRQGINDADGYSTLCAACHGAIDGNPEHAFGVPDMMTMASVTLSRFTDGNPRRPIEALVAGSQTRREVDFTRDLAPALSGCASCHQEAPLDLSVGGEPVPTAYRSLLDGGWVVPGSARRSPLAEQVLARELDAEEFVAPDAAHGGLSDDAVDDLLTWIDLGAAFVGTSP